MTFNLNNKYKLMKINITNNMKKALLIGLMSTSILSFSQSRVQELNVPNALQVKADASSVKAIDNEYTPGEVITRKNTVIKRKKAVNYDYIDLGDTYYDLQTNSSPGRRIILHTDGTVSAVWTTSPDAGTGYPNRGSGYNHYDGTNWLMGRDSKIESAGRTGWPTIMLLDDGSEMTIAHESNTGGFITSKNSAKGNTSFNSSNAILDDLTEPNSNRVPIWNRSAASNGKIHIISNYWASEANGVPVVTRNGVNSPTTYSRWDVNGDSADIAHVLLPGYDSTLFAAGGGDNYAIDVRDSIVAILLGGLGDPVSLWKSTDNGENWTYTDVDSFPFKGQRLAAQLLLSGDTVSTNDGSVDVMIDATGKVHAFWGLGRVLGAEPDGADTTGFSFFPGQSQIRHWKEGDATSRIAGSGFDLDQDGQFNVTAETFSSLDANQNVPANLLSATRTGNTSLVTMPSASADENGNLFVVYSAPVENQLHFLNANYRDIMVSYSTDGGETWMGPQNLTQDGTQECNFPSAAKVANDYLHVMWQQDATPGTFLQNHSASAGSHPNEINTMKYAAVPVADIINNVIGNDVRTASVDKLKTAEVFVVSQNQPNPFRGTSEVLVYLRTSSKVSLTVKDILGNVLNQGDLGIMNAGNHKLSIDANGLSSGMYFYTIATPEHQVTKRMQVK